jgi:hypothetical protein
MISPRKWRRLQSPKTRDGALLAIPVSQAVVLAQALLLLTYILSLPAASLWMKLLLTGAILIFYASGYYVWGLYTVRPMKYLARYGARINEIAETEQSRDAVVRLASHGGSSPKRPC